MPKVDDPFRPDPETRQFTMRRLLVLTVLCTAIAGTIQALDLSPAMQAGVTFWWLILAAYAVFRLPYGVLTLLGRTNRWKRLRAHRSELKEMAIRMRTEYQADRQRDDGDGPSREAP